MKEIRAGYNESGQRLDKLLRKVLPNANDSFIYKMLRKKNITLNDKKATGSEDVREGDVIRIWFSDETYAKFAGDAGDGRDDTVASEQHPGAKRAAAAAVAGKTAGRKKSDADAGLQAMFDDAVIYEDRDILVINKPAGMLSQKAVQTDVSAVELLINRMLMRGEITQEQLRTFHPSICNRLDRNTGGVLVCGKSLRGLQEMSELIRGRSVKKDYLAVVCGEVREGRHIKAFLVKDHGENKVRIIDDFSEERLRDEKHSGYARSETKKAAVSADGEKMDAERIDTEYRPIYTDGSISLIMVRIHTGKTHQIRAQMAALGHPLCGDVKYGGAKARKAASGEDAKNAPGKGGGPGKSDGLGKGGGPGKRAESEKTAFPRQLLHAYSLALPDGRRFIAPIPEDMRAAVGGYEWGHGRPADFEDLPLKI